MDMIKEIIGLRQKSTLYHVNDGYFYRKGQTQGGRVYLRCRSSKCLGRATMPRAVEERTVQSFKAKVAHNHDPDHTFTAVISLKQSILDRCRVEVTKMHKIFKEECARVPPVVAKQLTFGQLNSSMSRARCEGSTKDRNPQMLTQYAEMLGRPDNARYTKTVKNEQFYLGSVTNPTGGTSLIFGTPAIIELLPAAKEIHIDATFKVRPNVPPCTQLLTVMTMCFGRAFPVFFVIMEKRNYAAYHQVLLFIKCQVPELNPKMIITDFEQSLQRAVSEVYPDSELVGSWFHYANAMKLRARSLGLTTLMNDSAKTKKILKMTMALPLLPQDKILIGFERIKNFTKESDLIPRFIMYFNYIQQTWIEGVGTACLSVYGHKCRTNNDQELYHKLLLMQMNPVNPNIWVFTDALRKVEQSYVEKYCEYFNGRVDMSNPSAYIAQDDRIEMANELLGMGDYTELEFLHTVSDALSDVHNDVKNVPENDPDIEDICRPLHPLNQLGDLEKLDGVSAPKDDRDDEYLARPPTLPNQLGDLEKMDGVVNASEGDPDVEDLARPPTQPNQLGELEKLDEMVNASEDDPN